LTSDDRRELGIASVGHRRRLLDAIAALSALATEEIPKLSDAPSSANAERRQFTVIFCDLVGSFRTGEAGADGAQ
jgi:hypothetical protein